MNNERYKNIKLDDIEIEFLMNLVDCYIDDMKSIGEDYSQAQVIYDFFKEALYDN